MQTQKDKIVLRDADIKGPCLNKLGLLSGLGQSVWLDNISRGLINRGSLASLVAQGVTGLTSNPTIFEKAIKKESDYDEDILLLSSQGKSVFQIYDEMSIKDIQQAADLFLPLYEISSGSDGLVSLEVNPFLCDDTEETVKEAKRLHSKVSRPNLMLKIPATCAGFPAIKELIGAGLNVNVTLIFSLKQYEQAAEAYIQGLEELFKKGTKISVSSVASVFVSRIDTDLDERLDEQLKGRAASANCAMIYSSFRNIFSTLSFRKLQEKGARLQRPLWASTSTKNPSYDDIKYVQGLIAEDTVNTMPADTIAAFIDHGRINTALSTDTSDAESVLRQVTRSGVDMDEVCLRLLKKGIASFQESFRSLLDSIQEKVKANRL